MKKKPLTDVEKKANNERYLQKTKRWADFLSAPYYTVREAAYVEDVTIAEILWRIYQMELPAYYLSYGPRRLMIRRIDLVVRRVPPGQQRRWELNPRVEPYKRPT